MKRHGLNSTEHFKDELGQKLCPAFSPDDSGRALMLANPQSHVPKPSGKPSQNSVQYYYSKGE